jgi:hypothetical protein
MRAPGLPLMAAVLLAFSACGPAVDLSTGLQVDVISSGWYDAGIVNGENKLVPSVTFTLKNVSDQNLSMLQANAVFRRLTQKEEPELGSGFITVAGSSGLAPGGTSPVLTLKSEVGYTGAEPRAQMLQNPRFVDAKVQLFARYGSNPWKLIGENVVERRLITR